MSALQAEKTDTRAVELHYILNNCCSFIRLYLYLKSSIVTENMRNFKKLSLIGIVLELIIFLASYSISSDLSETFRLSARFSGRLSLFVFLITIWHFTRSSLKSEEELSKTRTLTAVFALMHYIHLFLLLMNVNLNSVTLIPHKLAGGILAYLMILFYPIFFDRIKNTKAVHSVYFLYVGFVMAMTYIARLNGEFEGASPELFHKIGLGLVLGSMVYYIYKKIVLPMSENSNKKI